MGFPPEYFRAGVGAVIVGRSGRVLVGRRADVEEPAWQFPQGGIQRGEDPVAAIRREVQEELGIEPARLSLEAEAEGWLTYELPEAWRSEKTGRGQSQRWFFFRLDGPEEDVSPDPGEFDAWQWLDIEEVLRQVARFRRPVYEVLLDTFRRELDGRTSDPSVSGS